MLLKENRLVKFVAVSQKLINRRNYGLFLLLFPGDLLQELVGVFRCEVLQYMMAFK